jgi:CubicO group peptidase (beta-lactamase class C family)
MALMRTLPLEERITAIRAEIDAIIDAKAEEEKGQRPGILLAVIRNLIIARNVGCQCRQYLEIKAKDDAEKERETAA